MKIFNLEATNMGTDQDEIAKKVLDFVSGIDFKTEDDFLDREQDYIEKACKELGWSSCPQTGGLLVNWNSPSGDFIK